MNEFSSRRVGLIAVKLGMTQIFDADGKILAVTLLQVDQNTVIANKTMDKDGYNAVVIGFGERKLSSATKSLKSMCEKAGCKPAKVIKEFRVSGDALVSIGKKLKIEHFVVGQYIDIHGVNTGKGFAGPMKLWNFRGLEATHGVSVSHRSHGATGQRQDPGKTFKGKKMAGRMGCEQVTVQNVKIVNIDSELGIIAVYGSVPGKQGSIVTLTDAVKFALPGGVKYPANIYEAEKLPENMELSDNAVQSEDMNQ